MYLSVLYFLPQGVYSATGKLLRNMVEKVGRLGTPPPPPLVEKPEGPSALQPTTEIKEKVGRNSIFFNFKPQFNNLLPGYFVYATILVVSSW